MFDFWRWARIDWSGGLGLDPANPGHMAATINGTRRPDSEGIAVGRQRQRLFPSPPEPATGPMTTRAFRWSDLKAEIDRETGDAA